MSKFQIILTGIFGIFIIIGVLLFAFARPNQSERANILVWGTISETDFSSMYSRLPLSKDKNTTIRYVYKAKSDFDRDFVEAIAAGVGPDVVFIGEDNLLKQKNKLFIVPFESYSERTFRDTFIQEGELFLNKEGIFAFPILIDPLVMYWNRDILFSLGSATPPKYWDEFYAFSKKFTEKDNALNLTRSAIAFGEFQNINNAKEIISTLIFQAGSPIISKTDTGYRASILDNFGYAIPPALSALNFYTEFSNPSKTHYSWNRSLPDSQTAFLSGDLAVYFGFASELNTLKLKNPNLNFDVSAIPQSRTGSAKITYGDLQGLAITKTSKNIAGALRVIAGLSSPEAISELIKLTGLPPIRKDVISRGTTDPFLTLFFESALWSRGWLDPDINETNILFKEMVESITSGRLRTEEALSQTEQKLQVMVNNFK